MTGPIKLNGKEGILLGVGNKEVEVRFECIAVELISDPATLNRKHIGDTQLRKDLGTGLLARIAETRVGELFREIEYLLQYHFLFLYPPDQIILGYV